MDTTLVRDQREGYPRWVEDIIHETEQLKAAVRDHDALLRMADGTITRREHFSLLLGFWNLIEKFPHYMALNLLKTTYGTNPGINAARSWLGRNLRIEQKHAQWFVEWAEASGLDRSRLFETRPPAGVSALSDWCWRVSHAGELATAMAATNFAIEGVTGEWCPRVASSVAYHALLRSDRVRTGLRWLRAHATYDDSHPWEAMDIIVLLVGPDPDQSQVSEIRHAIQKTYELHRLAFDTAMSQGDESGLHLAPAAQ